MAGQAAPFMDWENTEDPFKIKFLGFTTGWGSSGHWRLLDGNLKPRTLLNEDFLRIVTIRSPFFSSLFSFFYRVEGESSDSD